MGFSSQPLCFLCVCSKREFVTATHLCPFCLVKPIKLDGVFLCDHHNGQHKLKLHDHLTIPLCDASEEVARECWSDIQRDYADKYTQLQNPPTPTFRDVAHVTVKASPSYEDCLLPLSSIDCTMGEFFVPILLVYDYRIDTDWLVHSLSHALSRCYPLTGRFIEEQGRAFVDCRNQGCPLVVSETDACIRGVLDFSRHRDVHAYRWGMAHPRAGLGHDGPPLMARVVHTRDGCTVLWVSASHWVVDCASYTLFLNTWAEIHRQQISPPTTEISQGPRIMTPPIVDPRLESTLKIGATDDGVYPITTPSMRRYTVEEREEKWARYSKGSAACKVAVMRVSASQLTALKKEAQGDGPGWISTNDALVALLWKEISRARLDQGSGSSDDTCRFCVKPDRDVVRLTQVVDIRPRLYPQVLPQSFGNLILFPTTEKSILSVTDGDLCTLARASRSTISEYNADGVRGEWARIYRNFLNLGARMFKEFGETYDYSIGDLVVSTWRSFPVFLADFGHGAPSWFGMPLQPLVPGLVFILPVREAAKNSKHDPPGKGGAYQEDLKPSNPGDSTRVRELSGNRAPSSASCYGSPPATEAGLRTSGGRGSESSGGVDVGTSPVLEKTGNGRGPDSGVANGEQERNVVGKDSGCGLDAVDLYVHLSQKHLDMLLARQAELFPE